MGVGTINDEALGKVQKKMSDVFDPYISGQQSYSDFIDNLKKTALDMSNNNETKANDFVSKSLSSFDWSKVPASSLPTESDVRSGQFNPAWFPTDKPLPFTIQSPTVITEPSIDQQGNPVATSIPDEVKAVEDYFSTVSTKNMTPDELKINLQAKDQALALAKIQADQRVKRSSALTDLESYLTSKNQGLTSSLSDILNKGSEATFSREQPLIEEQLNTQGLLRSSGLGEALAREKAYLASQNAQRVGEYGVNLGTNLANTLGQAKQMSSAEDIASLRSPYDIGSQSANAGLQRTFSLQDWQREAALAKELGSMNTPQMKDSSGFNFMNAAGSGGLTYALMAANPATAPYALLAGGGSALLSGSKGGGK